MKNYDLFSVPGYRLVHDPNQPRVSGYEPLISQSTAEAFCRQFYFDDLTLFESMFLVLLTQNNTPIGFVKIGQGGVTGTVCDPKLVFKYALESVSPKILICHNHPSGNLTPSIADRDLTKRVVEGAKLFDIQLVDHIILTEKGCYSFANEGLL